MDFSTQLRVILLVAGGVAILCIYLLGKRHGRVAERSEQQSLRTAPPAVQDFGPVAEMDEDELDTPAYLRRSQQELRRDESLPSMDLPADSFRDDDDDLQVESGEETSDESGDETEAWIVEEDVESLSDPLIKDPEPARFLETVIEKHDSGETISAHAGEPVWRESIVANATVVHDIPVVTQAEAVTPDFEPPTLPNIAHQTDIPAVIPVIEQSVSITSTGAQQSLIESNDMPATATPSQPSAPGDRAAAQASATAAKTPSNSKRKIVALRLSMPTRVPGEQLLSLLQRENLQHGRFDIFHRMHEDVSVFSVASMVEPGSFNLSTMRNQAFPGVTLFMLLPGPLDGLVAWDQMYSCAQRLAHATQGVLQDERGQRLTSMAADRLREDVLDFQHLLGSVGV